MSRGVVLEPGRLSGRTSFLNDDGMAVCGILVIFITQKLIGSFLEVSHDSSKPTKVIIEQESKFGNYFKKRLLSHEVIEGHV